MYFRRDNVLRLWNYLLELLRARRSRLEDSIMLQQTFQEMIYILDTMEEIKVLYNLLLFLFLKNSCLSGNCHNLFVVDNGINHKKFRYI